MKTFPNINISNITNLETVLKSRIYLFDFAIVLQIVMKIVFKFFQILMFPIEYYKFRDNFFKVGTRYLFDFTIE